MHQLDQLSFWMRTLYVDLQIYAVPFLGTQAFLEQWLFLYALWFSLQFNFIILQPSFHLFNLIILFSLLYCTQLWYKSLSKVDYRTWQVPLKMGGNHLFKKSFKLDDISMVIIQFYLLVPLGSQVCTFICHMPI